MKLLVSFRSLVRRQLFACCALAALAAGSWMTLRCQAQLDPGWKVMQVLYQGDQEAGHVFRDGTGPKYTEHWVLFPNYTYDQGARDGEAIHIVAHEGPGYQSLKDFLSRVPFPKGSRYVVTSCEEFDELPGR
jgi:hypothetical protein